MTIHQTIESRIWERENLIEESVTWVNSAAGAGMWQDYEYSQGWVEVPVVEIAGVTGGARRWQHSGRLPPKLREGKPRRLRRAG